MAEGRATQDAVAETPRGRSLASCHRGISASMHVEATWMCLCVFKRTIPDDKRIEANQVYRILDEVEDEVQVNESSPSVSLNFINPPANMARGTGAY